MHRQLTLEPTPLNIIIQPTLIRKAYLVIREKLKEEAADDAGDASKEVDDNQEDVGSTGLLEEERGRVHHRGHRPAEENDSIIIAALWER